MDECKYFAAEEYFCQALRILTKLLGPDTLSVALTEVNLGGHGVSCRGLSRM
jgi:hypothetical protein